MKKTALAISLAAIGFALTAFVAPKVSTDNNFEGVVTYSVSTDNQQAKSMLQGSSLKVYMKGNKTKACSDMGMQKITVFADDKTPDDPTILVEIMGNKYQLKNDPTKKEDKSPVIKYTDETKQIAGYTCHKAEVTSKDKQGQSVTTDVYYTDQLPAYTGPKGQFKGLKGFPLEYSVQQRGISILYSATSVDRKSITDDTFTVPSGYKVMTQEEIMQDVQKNMGGGGN